MAGGTILVQEAGTSVVLVDLAEALLEAVEPVVVGDDCRIMQSS